MTTINNTLEKAKVAEGPHDCLSKQGARAVLFVLLLACLMAFSAILLILSNGGDGTAAARKAPETQACCELRSPA
jgi:hypothetical protein